MSQDDESAIEVTDVESAAQEIEARFNSQDEQVEETETDEVEVEATEKEEPEESEEEVEQEPEQEEEAATFQNITELADALNMSTEDFLSTIKATRKIDGVEEEVTISELLAGNQRDTDYRHKTMELAEQRKQFQAQSQQFQTQYQQQLTEAANMSQILENQMLQQYEGLDWNRLEQEDQQQWLVLRQKFQEDYAKVGQIKNNAQQQLQHQTQQQNQQQQQLKQQYIAKENDLLLSAIPDWSNSDTRASETKAISDFLTNNYGFNESDVSGVSDHRVVKLIRDAMKLNTQTGQVPIAMKRVKKLPKLGSPKGRISAGNKAKQKQTDAMKNYRKTQSNDDLTALLLDRM